MPNNQISKAASLMGRRSYRVRLDRFGIERIREIARENGKKSSGRPPKNGKQDGD
jgi:hypothetical protein